MISNFRKFAGKFLPMFLIFFIYTGGCAVISFLAGTDLKTSSPKTPKVVSSFSHMIHVESGLDCTDCHEGAQEEEEAGLPEIEFCEGCHSDELSEGYQKWMNSEQKEEDVIIITRDKLKGFGDITAPHNMHHYADLTCDICHGEIGESEQVLENSIVSKKFCMDCHDGQVDCKDCHKKIRKDAEPSSHQKPFWLETHGKEAFPEGGKKNKYCFLCHEEAACNKCHKKTKPSSHGESWERFHGTEVDMAFELQNNRCYFCHKQLECKTCHLTETPSSHTASWTNRTHGLHAETERDSCMVCHKQAYCARCHKAAPPRPRDVAHGPNADCNSCHWLLEHGFRGTENFECAKCHK